MKMNPLFKMAWVPALIVLTLPGCDLDIIGDAFDDAFDDFITLPSGNESRGIWSTGDSSYNGCVEAEESSAKSGLGLPGKLDGTVNIDNPGGDGSAVVTGVIDVDSSGVGSADISLTFTNWDSEGAVINGEGTFEADIEATTAGLRTTANIEGEYDIAIGGDTQNYNVDYELILDVGLTTTYSFDGTAEIDGTGYNFDTTISSDGF